jgi:hypothetical protein
MLRVLNRFSKVWKDIRFRYIPGLSRNWKDFYWWRRVAVTWIIGLVSQWLKGNKGIYVIDEDWDNLIVLDACRYDLFCEVSGLNAEMKISRGSCTGDLLFGVALLIMYGDIK